ncbi:MAG: HK97 gp10 family phage protein [Faecalibacterium sp.]|nr:HK97 gp10 family phage protein [Ruminococcus sp.]MCM1392103.1 HK97 gp10 family phage protein [Ruminococcus sp.]MCM1485800.1 HK97 gp10 family phage protein [Faecalibacterium sp.]
MSSAVYLNFEGFEALAESLEKMDKAAPDIVRKWLSNAGKKFVEDAIIETDRVTTRRTGNLADGYKRKLVINYTAKGWNWECEVNGGNRKARHFHLVENGHKQKAGNVYRQRGRGFRTSKDGFTDGKHMLENTVDNWQKDGTIISYAEKAMKEALKKGLI